MSSLEPQYGAILKMFKILHWRQGLYILQLQSNHIISEQQPDNMECRICHKKFKLESKIRHRQKCKPIQCGDCKTFFKTTNSLKRHLKNRKDILHDGTKFCNNSQLHLHLRTIKKPMEKIPNLDQQILEATGYENKKGFKDTVKHHINEIKDSHKTTKLYEVINRQITSSYTYKELY